MKDYPTVGSKAVLLSSYGRFKMGDSGTVSVPDHRYPDYIRVTMVEGELPWLFERSVLSVSELGTGSPYRNEVMRTAGKYDSVESQLTNAAMGLAGEAGEFCDLIKKVKFHKKPLDRDAAIKELGDIRWYLELAAEALSVSMDEIEAKNIEKLRKRYPNGFTPEAAAARVDVVTSPTDDEGHNPCGAV